MLYKQQNLDTTFEYENGRMNFVEDDLKIEILSLLSTSTASEYININRHLLPNFTSCITSLSSLTSQSHQPSPICGDVDGGGNGGGGDGNG